MECAAQAAAFVVLPLSFAHSVPSPAELSRYTQFTLIINYGTKTRANEPLVRDFPWRASWTVAVSSLRWIVAHQHWASYKKRKEDNQVWWSMRKRTTRSVEQIPEPHRKWSILWCSAERRRARPCTWLYRTCDLLHRTTCKDVLFREPCDAKNKNDCGN